jgi:hypothetical protein
MPGGLRPSVGGPDGCPRCGQPHPRCRAHNKAGTPCMRYPRDGAPVCGRHGGFAPQVIRATERRRQERAAEAAVATYGLPVDIAPTDALLEEVRWTAGHVAWLRTRVAELEADSLVWGTTKSDHQGATEAAAVNVWLDLYQRERRHLLDVCRAAIGAGIEERRVKLAESMGALLASVIRAILDDLDLTPEQQAQVPEVVPRRLRAVS